MTTQGIAILVYLLLLTEDQSVAHKTKNGIIAAFLILIAYICFWFFIDFHTIIGIIWQILISLGIVISTHAFTKKTEQQLKYMNE